MLEVQKLTVDTLVGVFRLGELTACVVLVTYLERIIPSTDDVQL